MLMYSRAAVDRSIRPAHNTHRPTRGTRGARPLQRRAKRRLWDESVLHINAYALFVHPTFTVVRIIR